MTSQKLQYNIEFYDKIVVSIISDQHFLLKAIDLDLVQYIDSQPHQWFVDFILQFYKLYKVVPTMQSIQMKIEQIKQKVLKQSLSTTFISIINAFQQNNLDFVKDTVINFCRFQQLKKAITTSIDYLQQENFEKIYDIINKTKYKGLQTNFGVQYVSSFEQRYNKEALTWIQTPWPVLNNVLRGGLRATKFGVVLASPGAGKSWILSNLAAHAMKQDKKVIYYTLEMTQQQIGYRIDSILSKRPLQYIERKQNWQEIKKIIQPYKNNLRIKQFLPNDSSPDDVQNHINQLALFENYQVDLVIIDYADILKKKGDANKMYAAYGDVYTELKRLAKQYKIPIWTASQSNREGISSQFVLGQSVAHSLGKLQIADFMWSISRKQQDKMSNTARFAVIKNRGGRDGFVFNGIVDFDIGEIQIFDNFTKNSVQARQKMDNNDRMMKQTIRQRLETLRKKQKQEN